MHILADENMPYPVVEALRLAGHDVAWVAETDPGIPDPAVLARAVREHRLLLTLDKDFGALAFDKDATLLPGIVLLRLPQMPPTALAAYVVNTLMGRVDRGDYFSVLDGQRTRMRPLPAKP